MKKLYTKLALSGISKNLNIYVPFAVAYGFLTMVYNIMGNIIMNKTLARFSGMGHVIMLLKLGQYIMILFSLIFLRYANNYIMQKRSKEFGLYNILGLEKKQISMVVVVEMLIIVSISVLAGILLSNLLFKLIGDIFFKIIDFEGEAAFIPDINSSLKSLVYFSLIGIGIIALRIIQIYRSSSLELFTKSRKSERHIIPISVKAVLGVICIAVGYYIALTIESPFSAVQLFFLAVILVILGTYWSFSAISAVVLNLLKLNKKFYYKTNNFVAVSALRQRIKQNSSGLASICIMSCAALVLLGSAVALYFTSDRMIEDMMPRDFSVKVSYFENDSGKNIFDDIKMLVSNKGGNVKNYFDINYSLAVAKKVGSELKVADVSKYGYEDITSVAFIDINSLEKYDGSLSKGEAWYYSDNNSDVSGVTLGDTYIKTTKKLDSYKYANTVNDMSIFNSVYLFVDNIEQFKESYTNIMDDLHYYAFDVYNVDAQELYGEIIKLPYEDKRILEKSIDKDEFMGIYGTVFFVGLFLGIVFIIATALVIYYKQLSEGFEDRNRFRIYRNVGMTEREIKKSISTQVKTIFLLPPVTAGIHIAVAFKIVSYVLSIIGLYSIKYKALSFIGVYAFYLLSYAAIYKLTSKAYYNIVSE